MKVLIVDDSRAMRMIVKRTLRQAGFTGLTIQEASNGKEALDTIISDSPDLVLTDWNMPEMTGIELLHALKEQSIKVKVGVVTSQGTAEMQSQAKDAGALFLLAKPFTADSFRAALEPVI
jgi:two-component system chemotaxis response regulator CheY